MTIAEQSSYLKDIREVLKTHWPENRSIHIVCHGHSVPAGYFATPMVDSMNAYPHLLHCGLKERFPFAVMNVIVTAIGGEDSQSGSERFENDVLNMCPDVITIDYALNDRGIGLQKSRAAWSAMIESALAAKVKVILLTPTPDMTMAADYKGESKGQLEAHAQMVRDLAAQYNIAMVDSLTACMQYSAVHDLSDILSWSNHPNRRGHDLVVQELMRWFPAG